MAGANDQATLIIVLEAQARKLQSQLVDVTKQIDRFSADTTKRFEQMNAANAASFDKLGTQVRGSLGSITSALATLGLGVGIKQVLDYANTWEVLKNKLASASAYSGLQADSLENINKAASAARTPLENYLSLYSRILNVSGNLHLTELQVASATDLVSKAFKIGGSTAAQQAGGIIQIVEALDMGRVQGRQLRAMSTDAIVVSQALAQYMHTSVGGLKALGAAGKITSEDLIQAILAYKDKINTAFTSTTVTISDAITKIDNAFLEYVGTQGEATGATKKLVDALTYLADNFKTIAPIVLDFVAIIAGAFAAKAFVGFAGAIGEATAALGVFLGTIAAGEFSVAAFSAALGPMALIVGAAATAFYILNNATDPLTTTLTTLQGAIGTIATKLETAKNASVAFRGELSKQIDIQLQAADAALAEAGAQYKAAQSKGGAVDGMIGDLVDLGAVFTGQDTHFGKDMAAAGTKAATSDAMVQINKARDAVAALQKQKAQLDQIDKTKPGTADSAPGDPNAIDTSGKTKSNPYDSAKTSVEDRTAALVAERQAQSAVNPLINDYNFALDKAKVSQELLAAAQKAGIAITPTLRTAIDALASGYAAADVASKKLAESQQELRANAELFRDTMKDATGGFINDLIAGKSAAEALGNALSAVGNKLLSFGLDSLFGGGSASKSSPFGVIGQLFGFANGGIASHGRPLPLFAGGGISSSAAIFGENGAEAAVPLPDGRRIPVDLRMPAANDNGSISVQYAPTIHAPGADSATVAKIASVVAQDRADFESRVIGAVRKAKQSRKL